MTLDKYIQILDKYIRVVFLTNIFIIFVVEFFFQSIQPGTFTIGLMVGIVLHYTFSIISPLFKLGELKLDWQLRLPVYFFCFISSLIVIGIILTMIGS